jgi:hypothetical protein
VRFNLIKGNRQKLVNVMGKSSMNRRQKQVSEYTGVPADDIRAGNPEAYFDHIEKTCGHAFRSGTTDAAETFYLLYQQISEIGNAQSTELFLSRFLPLLSRSARRKIINDVMPNARPRTQYND